MRTTLLFTALLVTIGVGFAKSPAQNKKDSDKSENNNQEFRIQASAPTHYFYTPTPYVNEPWNVVVGLHEMSICLPYNLQLQASLVDNIGRINFGAKYGFTRQFSVGAGLAYSLAHFGRGNHGIPHYAAPRFGAYAVFGPVVSDQFELGITPQLQVGDRVSAGVDLGMQIRPNPVWSIIWEFGSSFDFEDDVVYLNTDGGVRVNPPKAKFLYFDAGVDLEEFKIVKNTHPTVTAFFDVLFAFVAKQ
jgi:hypothetical protein